MTCPCNECSLKHQCGLVNMFDLYGCMKMDNQVEKLKESFEKQKGKWM